MRGVGVAVESNWGGSRSGDGNHLVTVPYKNQRDRTNESDRYGTRGKILRNLYTFRVLPSF